MTRGIESDESESDDLGYIGDINSLHEKEDDINAVDDITLLTQHQCKWSSITKLAMHSTTKGAIPITESRGRRERRQRGLKWRLHIKITHV